MKKLKQKYKILFEKLIQSEVFSFLRKKAVVFSIVAVPLASGGAGMTIYIDNLSNVAQEPIFAQEAVVNLDENIIVQFKDSIHDIQNYEESIITYPATSMKFVWSEKNAKLTIIPKTIWKPKTEYSLALPYNSHKAHQEQSTIFSFETVAYPVVTETSLKEKENKYIDEGDEIVISFDQSIEEFDIQAVTRPLLNTEQIYDTDTRTLRIRVKERAQDYKGFHSLTLFAKHKTQEKAQFYPVHSLTFNTLLPRPNIWPELHQERLDIAKASTAPQILDGRYIDVNLEAQITTLFEDGDFITNFVTSTGALESPTPIGEYEIYNKHPYALSNMFQVYLPHWLAFTPDGLYGFHGLIVWPKGHEDMPSGGKESQDSIGNAVSAGCVRHDAQNSQFLYDWAEVGTKAVIY